MIPFLIRAMKEMLGLSGRDWISMAFIAVGGSVAATSLFTFSIKYGNPSVTVLLQKTQPIFTILLARFFLRERPGRWFWRCLIVAVSGAYLVSTPDWRAGFQINPEQPMSILAALGAACLWGSCTVIGRYIVGKLPVAVLTGLRFTLALPVLAILFGLQLPEQRLLPVTLHSASLVAGMALIPGLAALIFYYQGLRCTIASVASVAELAFPVTAVVANYAFLGIQLTQSQFWGGLILVSSVTALTYLDAREKTAGAHLQPTPA